MQEKEISFVSLGLVVLDEIWMPNRDQLTNILGGSGSYATLGARLFLQGSESLSLGWMIRCGDDFPISTERSLRKWTVKLAMRKKTNQASTRGLLEYRDATFGPKDFKYTTPPLSVTEPDLDKTPLLRSKSYHYLTSPEDIAKRTSSLLALRRNSNILERPLIIWEPLPLSCIPSNLDPCLSAIHSVDIFSPNHLELVALFSIPASDASNKELIEDVATQVLAHGVGPNGKGTILVRAGEHGCLVLAEDLPATWLPPYYSPDSTGKRNENVVDPTGAGNAFLGAFAIGLLKTGDRILAACYGAVGASFALEQVGMPVLDEHDEVWNGVRVLWRLQEYLSARGLR